MLLIIDKTTIFCYYRFANKNRKGGCFMKKLYNNQEDIASGLKEFLLKAIPDIRKTQLKIIPFIIIGILLSESVVASDIAKKLKGDFSLVQHESVIRRITRFFTNKLFKPYFFYDKVIRYVISNYKKKHNDKRIHIVFDHMYSHDNYVVFMITMRIGKQGIPLWFRCFRGEPSEAFQETLIMEGISYVCKLFGSDYELIFLADRWFNSVNIMKHIDNLKHTFCLRLKRNIKVLVYDKKEGRKIWKLLSEVKHYEWHSSHYEVLLTEDRYEAHIVLSKKNGTKDPWIIVTNGDPKRAIKDYGYRFGAIEFVFKNQKSNGFYLESVCNASEAYFTSMYTMACFSVLYMTILGADYSKNTKCYKDVSINTHKTYKDGTKIRIMSLFNAGLTLFNLAYESFRYIRIPYSFKLYDI